MKIGQIKGFPVLTITCTDCRETLNVLDDIDKVYISMGSMGTFHELYTMQGRWLIDGNYVVKTKAV